MVYLHSNFPITVPDGSWPTTTETKKCLRPTTAYFSQFSHCHLRFHRTWFQNPKPSVAGVATALQVWSSTMLIAIVTVQQRSVLHWYNVHRSSNKDRVTGSSWEADTRKLVFL